MGPPSLPSLPPSILLLSSSGWPGLPPLVFVPIVSFYNTSNVFSSATPSVGGRGKYPVAAPVPFEGSGEVPSGRPRTFCGGSGGREGCREGATERGIVTASLCWSQPHSQTQGAHLCPVGFVSGAAASTNLLS